MSLRTLLLAQRLSVRLVLAQDKNINGCILGFKSAKNTKPNRAESHAGIPPVAGLAQGGDPYNFYSLLSAHYRNLHLKSCSEREMLQWKAVLLNRS